MGGRRVTVYRTSEKWEDKREKWVWKKGIGRIKKKIEKLHIHTMEEREQSICD